MTLPSAYLITTSKTADFLNALKKAQAPPRFTQKFLEGLGFTSTNDRLWINVLKALGFLKDTGEPLPRYFDFLDESQSGRVLAEALREAYADLFQVRADAETMSKSEVKNKMKTLSQGEHSDKTVDRMAATFKSLAEQADFSAQPEDARDEEEQPDEREEPPPPADERRDTGHRLNGLHYNINIHLPESRDPAVYDALFRSLREHLL